MVPMLHCPAKYYFGLFVITILWGSSYYFNFADDKTEAQREVILPKAWDTQGHALTRTPSHLTDGSDALAGKYMKSKTLLSVGCEIFVFCVSSSISI